MQYDAALDTKEGQYMRLITYLRNQSISCGILTSTGVVDISSAWRGPNPPRTVKEILQRGSSCLDKLTQLADLTDTLTPLESVKLLAPILRPGKVIALAGNYVEHIKEAGLKLGLSDSPRKTTVPRPFLMPPTVVIGPDEQIPWPVYSEQIDYELELAVVIGKKDKCVEPGTAPDVIAGYTIANDVSARSVTFAKNRAKRPWDEFYDWLNGKWADGFLPMGPYLLTADEIPDVQNLNMTLTVNGQVRQKANTSQMIYPVADVVSFLSHIMTLEPGDVIATGTPSGVGFATGNYLQPGDRIECTIEKLGTLTNTLGLRPEKSYEPLA
jgi:2-keto-4-pentenoate hydratase/2-oxohepta-3-ene-1,7-dioic acid hydratase in catechol pathway